MSQFEEAMSFEFLMSTGVTPQTHQLSCLVGGPGSVVADRDEGLAFLVLAKAQSGCTAWVLEIFSEEDGTTPGTEDFFFKPVAKKLLCTSSTLLLLKAAWRFLWSLSLKMKMVL